MDTRYLIARLREQRGLLAARKAPGPKWLAQTREVIDRAWQNSPELEADHGSIWQQETMAEKADYLAALDKLIRTINRTDEVVLSRNPVVIFTLLGILFMFLLAGGSYLYYALVIAR
ncbi:MAG: hypothetical protein QNK37_15630 [Acidobacteriota bacterium]|nr:hypothetical protein [Acidobacteriota bacterium]